MEPESAKQPERSAKVPVEPETRPWLTFIRLGEAPPPSSFFRPPHLPLGRPPPSLSPPPPLSLAPVCLSLGCLSSVSCLSVTTTTFFSFRSSAARAPTIASRPLSRMRNPLSLSGNDRCSPSSPVRAVCACVCVSEGPSHFPQSLTSANGAFIFLCVSSRFSSVREDRRAL